MTPTVRPSAFNGTPSHSSASCPRISISPFLARAMNFFRFQMLRAAMTKHVCRCSACLANAKGIPRVRVGNIGINLVAVEREVDQLPFFVVQRDVEVVRVHQLADDLVDLGVERGHVLGGARRLGDAIQGGLDLLGVLVRSLAGLELRDLLVGSGQLVGGSDLDEDFFDEDFFVTRSPQEDRDQGHSGFPSDNVGSAAAGCGAQHSARIDHLPSMSACRHRAAGELRSRCRPAGARPARRQRGPPPTCPRPPIRGWR